MGIISSRQKRLLRELAEVDRTLAGNEEPIPSPKIAGKKPVAPIPEPEPQDTAPETSDEAQIQQQTDAKEEKPKLGDAEKMAHSMNDVAKLKMCLEVIKQTGYELSGGDKSFSLGGMANPITGTLATPVTHLDSIIKRLEKDLYDKASKRGEEVAQAYQELSTPSPRLAQIGRAIAMLPVGFNPHGSDKQRTSLDSSEIPESIEHAVDTIGLTEDEKTILYGAINEALVTGMIAFKPYDQLNKEVPKIKKKIKDSDFPEWYGEYLQQ